MGKAEPVALTDLAKALKTFAFPSDKTQSSRHIKRLHWYVACRLVIEGGFHPDWIKPRPPFQVIRSRGKMVLHHDPSVATAGERTVLGGLKTKKIDVTAAVPGIGPALAISLKGTHNAFRNLTNRMEEAAGDCTNIHLAYPALVYGFWHVVRANEEADEAPSAHFDLVEGRYDAADITVHSSGELASSVARLAHALERLSERDDLRDAPSSYEACALTLASGRLSNAGQVYPSFPPADHILDYNRFFGRLYALYDLRFVYQAPQLAPRTTRLVWSPDSPFLRETVLRSSAFAEMTPRVSS